LAVKTEPDKLIVPDALDNVPFIVAFPAIFNVPVFKV
jgi:hypothetical protein